jgi:hypothetical protein
MAGLPVVSDEMAREKFGGMLYLNVAALHSKLGESDSYAITLELSQPASLLRDPTILVPLAVTWDARTIGKKEPVPAPLRAPGLADPPWSPPTPYILAVSLRSLSPESIPRKPSPAASSSQREGSAAVVDPVTSI